MPLIDTSGDTRTRDTTGAIIESRHLRRSVGQFVTGVTVVTYDLDGSPRGVTVNSFTSISVDPPLNASHTPRSKPAITSCSWAG